LVPEELVDLGVLRNHGQLLIKQVFEVKVLCPDDECPCPQVRPPVAHCLDEADQFTLISGKLGVVRGDGATEKCDWSNSMVQDDAEPSAGRVAVHIKGLGEVGHMQDQHRHEGYLQCLKCHCHLWCPAEGVMSEESGKQCSDLTVQADELVMISSQSQESADRVHSVEQLPGPNDSHLVGVHGNTLCRDDVA
jgi:hypothetical protein